MSKINIYSIEYNIDFQSLNGWKTQSGDAFVYPVSIGNQECFIKKFKKAPPKSRALIEKLCGEELIGVSSIYGFIKETEFDYDVFYLVQKLARGEVMEDVFKKAEIRNIDLKEFVNKLYAGLQEIHNRDYWHCDLCFKNILIYHDEYTLIDIDSCLSKNDTPTKDRVINQDLLATLMIYIKNRGFKLQLTKLSGQQYNLLQLAIAICHLAFMKTRKLNCSATALNKTSEYLIDLNNDAIFELLLKGLNQNLEMRDFEILIDLLPKSMDFIEEKNQTKTEHLQAYLNKCLSSGVLYSTGDIPFSKKDSEPPKNEPQSKVKVEEDKKQPLLLNPHIDVTINGISYDNFKAGKKNLKKNETVTYGWVIKNATKFYLNGVRLDSQTGKESQKILTDEFVLKFNAVNISPTGVRKKVERTFRLPVETIPEIRLFEINQKKNTRFSFNKNEKVIISWDVKNGSDIYLNELQLGNQPRGTRLLSFDKSQDIQLMVKYQNVGGIKTMKSKIIKILIREEDLVNTSSCSSEDYSEDKTEKLNAKNDQIFEVIKIAVNEISVKDINQITLNYSEKSNLQYQFKHCSALIINDKDIQQKQGAILLSNDISYIEIKAQYIDANYNVKEFIKEIKINRKQPEIKIRLSFWQKVKEFFRTLFN